MDPARATAAPGGSLLPATNYSKSKARDDGAAASKRFENHVQCAVNYKFRSSKPKDTKMAITSICRAANAAGITCIILGIFAALGMCAHVSAGVAELLSVNMSDPAIQEFRQKGHRSPFTSDQLLNAVKGFKIPVLDFTQPPDVSPTGFKAAQAKLSKFFFSTDEEQKVWYFITREYDQPNVSITISGDLRVQSRVDSNSPSKPPQIEIVTPGETISKDEDFISAQVNMHRFPDIPYVIDIECTPETRAICSNREFLSKLPNSVALIAVPVE